MTRIVRIEGNHTRQWFVVHRDSELPIVSHSGRDLWIWLPRSTTVARVLHHSVAHVRRDKTIGMVRIDAVHRIERKHRLEYPKCTDAHAVRTLDHRRCRNLLNAREAI